MAETLLSFGVERLWELLVRESQRFRGFEEQFNELNSDLDMLMCFLKDADAKKHTSEMVRNTLKEIKEIVYDAEDIIETFLLKQELEKTSGIRNTVKWLSSRRGLAVDMRAISKRIAKVIGDMPMLGVQQVIVNIERDTQTLQEKQRQMRKTFPTDNEDHLVGLEENVEQLIGYLVEKDSIQVVSITGMGGIGKTTLARQVFNHEMVKNHFDGVAWVCVSQQFTRTYVWQTILQQLSSKQNEQRDSNMSEDEIHEKLFRLLETSNSLIVLDDMWREEDWDIIKPVFPSKKGWKILLTSRNENVALRADPMCVTFKPACLSPDDCWTLFGRITFPRKDTLTEFEVDVELEDIGRQMINHCGGLPLAIKVLGGLLAAQRTLTEWKRIFENIKSHIIGGTSFNGRNISSVYHILNLSYEEMPIYLKHCFLYLAHFPEDSTIDVEKLSHYWAAEGIQRPRHYNGATIREVADGYIEELVKRNMVIAKRDDKTSRFEKCHLHDMMKEVCLGKAKEENFVHIVDIPSAHSPCKSRRIAVHMLDETYHMQWEMMNPKLRSILFMRDYWRIIWVESRLCFKRIQLMRVLDLSFVKFKGGKLPSDIGKLIHLRYLNLYQAEVTHLPSSIRNLKLLLYLNLLVNATSLSYVPNFMKEMRELTDLYLPKLKHYMTKLELGNSVNLETLKNFSTHVKDLQRMTKLRNLSINNCCLEEDVIQILEKLPQLKEVRLESYAFAGRKMVCSANGFPQLHKLTLVGLKEWEEWEVKEGSMPLLHTLYIWNCPKLKKVPGGFPQLHRLELHELEEWEEWMVEECSMPLLHYLNILDCPKLKKVPDMFPQLHRLELFGLDEWEEWIVEEGSMPLLHTLDIDCCPKLKELPDGLRFLYSLKHLKMDKKWKERLLEGGEDYYKVKHIPFVHFRGEDEE